MRFRTLGHSGIEASTLALGTMMFGSWGNTDESECHRMVDLAIDAGVTLFDTADIYDQGVSEHILGDALRGRRGKAEVSARSAPTIRQAPTAAFPPLTLPSALRPGTRTAPASCRAGR